jgi:periplasmic protein TonB
MNRNQSLCQFEYLDNPWRRFPVVLIVSLILWGLIIWGVGFLLEQMAEQSLQLKPIDAQLIEIPAPIKHAVIPKSSGPNPIHQSVMQLPKQIQSIAQAPAPVSAPAAPAVSLPASRAQTDNDSKVSVATSQLAKGPGVSNVSITPPQFGAAYLNNPKPIYPAFARRTGIEGTVMLKVLVSREGDPVKIDVAKSSGFNIFDIAAVDAVKKWRFVPARKGDKSIEEWVLVPIAFRLNK